MAKRSYSCAYCTETFASPSDHISHLMQAHPRLHQGRVHREWQLRRPSFCPSCASEIAVGERLCSCGAIAPAFRSVA